MQWRAPSLIALSALALAAIAVSQEAQAASVLGVDLGTSSAFAILAGAGITLAAPPGTSISGDIGSSPTESITGLENATLQGVNHAGDGVTLAAKIDLALAFADAGSRVVNFAYSDGYDLNGTLGGGVYASPGSFTINNILTLDAGGDSSMVWIFRSGSTLNAASGCQVILAGGALASNVFWQVGSSATIGTNAHFAGNIIAAQSITLGTGAVVHGRALAINGAVSMGSNNVSIPEPSGALMLGLSSLGLLRRRRQKP